MKLTDIRKLNQRIYELDVNILRSNKVIFIATLLFCLTQNKDFRNVDKLTTFINFVDQRKRPIDYLIDLAKQEIERLNLLPKTKTAIFDSMQTISGVNTGLDKDREAFKNFITDFITKDFVNIKSGDLFLETLYMAIDKKADSTDKGVVLTPVFAAQLMVDLADIDYKKDVVADLCSGTGLFSLLSYSKMLNDMETDLKNKDISQAEYNTYQKKLYNSIIANDNEPKMVTLCLTNFLLKSLNHSLLFHEDVLKLQKSSFKVKEDNKEVPIKPNKAILNPPYEDKYKPLEILEKNIQLVRQENSSGHKVVVIIPPQKFGQKKDVFSRILNMATLESVIKMQDDLFTDSGKSQPASIFVFSADRAHRSTDKIRYYNFTDSGYVYLKDSGLVDKNNTHEQKKKDLLDCIKQRTESNSSFVRTWTNFYDVNKEQQVQASVDPSRIRTNKEEADVTFENITIKKMLAEKTELINDVNNNFEDKDGSFEKYIVSILSED